MPKIELYALVTIAQEYISRNYATVLADKNRRQELENCIGKYLYCRTAKKKALLKTFLM